MGETGETEGGSGTSISVLVADDHPIYRDGVVRAIDDDARLGVVTEAADGAEALVRIREMAPLVAIVDLRMPQVTGLELIQEVIGGRLSTAVVLLSAETSPVVRLSILDFALLCALVVASGGAYSQGRKAFFVVPLVAALSGRPKTTALWAAAATGAYVLVVAAHPAADGPGGRGVLFSYGLYLPLTGTAAVALSALASRRLEQERHLTQTLRTLIERVRGADLEARRTLAYELHDHAVQNLLAVRRELRRVAAGDEEAVARAHSALTQTVGQIRGTITDLYPRSLETGGLEDALVELAETVRARSALEVVVTVDQEVSGARCLLVYTCVRELLVNVEKHARAARTVVAITIEGSSVVASVSDDGVGLSNREAVNDPPDGQFGLASVQQRVASAGGELVVVNGREGGTVATLRIPEFSAPMPTHHSRRAS